MIVLLYYIAVSCFDPPTLQNARITSNSTSFVDDLAVYECDPGYVIRENKENITISCTSGGNWSNVLDSCVGKFIGFLYTRTSFSSQ